MAPQRQDIEKSNPENDVLSGEVPRSLAEKIKRRHKNLTSFFFQIFSRVFWKYVFTFFGLFWFILDIFDPGMWIFISGKSVLVQQKLQEARWTPSNRFSSGLASAPNPDVPWFNPDVHWRNPDLPKFL